MTVARIQDILPALLRIASDFVLANQKSADASEKADAAEQAAADADARAVSAQRSAGLTPQDFGAVGDGVADDRAAIQAAVDFHVATGKAWMLRFPPGDYRISAEIDLTAATMDYSLLGHQRGVRIIPDAFGADKACFRLAPSTRAKIWGFTFGTGTAHKNHPIGIYAPSAGRMDFGDITGSGLGNTLIWTTRPFNADWTGPFDLFFGGWQPIHKDVNVATTTLTLASGSAVVTASTAVFDADDVGEDIQIYHDPDANEAITARILSVESATQATLNRNMVVSGAARKFSFTAMRAVVSGNTVTFRKPIGLEAADVGRMIYIDKAGTGGALHATKVATVAGSDACTLDTAAAVNGTFRVYFTPTVYIGGFDIAGTGPNDIFIDKMLIEGFKGPGLIVDGGLHVKFGELKIHGRAWGDFSNFGQTCEAIIWNNAHKSFISHLEMEFCGKSSDGGVIKVHGSAPGLTMEYMSHNAPLVGGYLFEADFTDTLRGAFDLPVLNGRSNLDRYDGILKTSSVAVRRRVFASGRIGGASPAVEASAQHPQLIGAARGAAPVFIANGGSFVFRPASTGGFIAVAADDATGFWGLWKFNPVGCSLVNGSTATATLGTAASLNVFASGGLLTIQNNSGADRRFHISTVLG